MNLSIVLLLLSTCVAAFAVDLNAPSVSANALFLYRNSNFHKEDTDLLNPDQDRNGFNLREAELQFYSDVDPYTRMRLLLSIHPELESSGGAVEEKWLIEPEEGFVESNAVSHMTLKIGKFKAAMGKHNILHTHAFAFIDAPLANVNLLGGEGLNDVGVSAAVLLPTSWFSEVTLQFLRGEGENAEFNSPTPGDGVGLGHWKNLFDLSDALTIQVGASFAQGANALAGTTSITGGDLTFKWRPTVGGKYQSLLWATEYLGRTQSQPGITDETVRGVASWFQYQFTEQWAVLYRHDNLTVENSFDPVNLPVDSTIRSSAGLIFAPSEFSSYKLEFSQKSGGVVSAAGDITEKAIYLQANFTIGAHPSHSY